MGLRLVSSAGGVINTETFGEDGLQKSKMLIYVITLQNLRRRLFLNILEAI